MIRDFCQILELINYDLQSNYKIENPAWPTEHFQIQKYIISPNAQFIVLVITKEKILPVSYLIHEYLIEIIKISGNEKIRDGDWLSSDGDQGIFSQFTSDSKYFISHSLNIMCIIDLLEFQTKKFDEIDAVYTIDDYNQVYLFKEESIQIYQIESQQFVIMISLENPYFNISQISSGLFLGLEEKFQIFQLLDKLKIKLQHYINKDVQTVNQILTMENNFFYCRFGEV